MKYRVKKIEWEDSITYYPQRKKFLFWKYYYRNNFACEGYRISCQTEKEAWDYIKNHREWPLISYEYENR